MYGTVIGPHGKASYIK